MLDRLQRIATVLSRVRSVLLLLATASAILLLLSLVPNPWVSSDRWLMPSLVGLLWALTLYSLSCLFLSVPAPAGAGMKWRERLSRKIRRGGLWVLATVFIALSLALMLLTWQLLRVFFM